LRRDDSVLEIGPGSGLALELMASRVRSLVAVERSGAMLKRVQERLRSQKNFHGIGGDWWKVDLKDWHFTRVFAFNVSGFMTDKNMFRALLPHLTRNARVGIFYQNPPASSLQKLTSMLQQLRRNAEDNQFVMIEECLMPDMKTTPTGGVIFQL